VYLSTKWDYMKAIKKINSHLTNTELDILNICIKMFSQKISIASLFRELKEKQNISIYKFKKIFNSLKEKNQLYLLGKFNHPKAVKTLYLGAEFIPKISKEHHYKNTYKNKIFLKLLALDTEFYYDDNIDFYLPKRDEIIIGAPFIDERRLFTFLLSIEAFIICNKVKKITVVTDNSTGDLKYPFASVTLINYKVWESSQFSNKCIP